MTEELEVVAFESVDQLWTWLAGNHATHPGVWVRLQTTRSAVPSVAPARASGYFSKTECFCFTAQTLQAGEAREMPVRFIVDPNLPGMTYTWRNDGTILGTDRVLEIDGSAFPMGRTRLDVMVEDRSPLVRLSFVGGIVALPVWTIDRTR